MVDEIPLQTLVDEVVAEIKSLDYREYFCCLWVICRKALLLYQIAPASALGSLADRTLETLRSCVDSGNLEDCDGSFRALDLEWDEFLENAMISGGEMNIAFVLQDISLELAGEAPRYSATSRVLRPFRDLSGYGFLPVPGKGFRVTSGQMLQSDDPLYIDLNRIRRAIALLASSWVSPLALFGQVFEPMG